MEKPKNKNENLREISDDVGQKHQVRWRKKKGGQCERCSSQKGTEWVVAFS